MFSLEIIIAVFIAADGPVCVQSIQPRLGDCAEENFGKFFSDGRSEVFDLSEHPMMNLNQEKCLWVKISVKSLKSHGWIWKYQFTRLFPQQESGKLQDLRRRYTRDMPQSEYGYHGWGAIRIC